LRTRGIVIRKVEPDMSGRVHDAVHADSAIAGRAGLANFGTVAIDGTKIAANASIDANRGHDWLSEQVNRRLSRVS